MRRVPKTLSAALITFLLALGVAACGGGDDSDTTATEAVGQQQPQTDSASQEGGQGKKSGSSESDTSSGGSEGGEGQSGGDAGDFVPKKHSDSGGGAEQFKVKGGDNSVQEFGAEADAEEFDAAAVALHNFLDARAEDNWAAACEYVSKSVIESLEQLAAQVEQTDDASCGAMLENLTNPAAAQLIEEEAAKADVRSLRIEGERAFVIYTGIDGAVMAISMANEDGDWKVASLAGAPLS